MGHAQGRIEPPPSCVRRVPERHPSEELPEFPPNRGSYAPTECADLRPLAPQFPL